jgi:hypothetical protein
MDGTERDPEKLRPIARAPSSEEGDSGADHVPPLYGGLPNSRRYDSTTGGRPPPTEEVRRADRLPTSFLVVDRAPPEGFASPFRLAPDIEDRWFRPAADSADR